MAGSRPWPKVKTALPDGRVAPRSTHRQHARRAARALLPGHDPHDRGHAPWPHGSEVREVLEPVAIRAKEQQVDRERGRVAGVEADGVDPDRADVALLEEPAHGLLAPAGEAVIRERAA